ncbi:ML3 [Symbiodinium natans]|uniref:ML3 protein n=1 Tax=Symbiodinium natans TaxID=878477 RepID=A0A812V1B9_9DINO|nr:ML3 [Symbiodinium natans]
MWKAGKGGLKGRSHGRGRAEGETTVVLTGLPKTLNAEILLDLLDKEFPCCYDFFYLPMYLDQLENTGLAYINFRDHEKALECQHYFEGSINWGGHISDRPCKAQWSSIQGYEANITRHRKAAWNDKNLPEDCKPMAFDEQGRRLPPQEVFTPLHAQDSGKGGKVGRYRKPGKSKSWEDEWYGASKSHPQKGGNWPGWYTDHNIANESNLANESRQSDTGYAGAAFEPFDDGTGWIQADWHAMGMMMTAEELQEGDESWGNPNEGSMEVSALDLYLAGIDRCSDEEGAGLASPSPTWAPPYSSQESADWKIPETFRGEPLNDEDFSNTLKVDPFRQKTLPNPLIPELPAIEHLQALNILNQEAASASPHGSPHMSPASSASEPGQLHLGKYGKYACPNCKLTFAKWSACQHHLVTEMNCWCVLEEGRLPSDVTELQGTCKAAAEQARGSQKELPKDSKDSNSSEAFFDEAIQEKVLRFQ